MTVENTTAPVVETTDAPNDLVADPEVVETEGPDAEATEAPGEIEIDITEDLSDDQIRDLFAAFNDEDWSEVDRLIDEFEATGVWGGTETEGKAGGADRNRGSAEKLRRYWTVGVGGQKIRWGTSGDFRRCVALLSKHLGIRASGYCANRHKEMNGFWPGSKLNKGDDGDMQTKDTGDQNPAMMEFKTLDLKGLDVVDAEQGIVEAIVSVTGVVDNVNDLILPGAYAKTLAARTPKGVYSHSWTEPVSRTLDVKELMPGDPELPKTMPNGDPWPAEAGALKVKTQFNLSTQRGREAYSDVVFFGDDSAWSIGYQVPVGGAKIDQKSGVRRIADIDLYEYSPVLFGAMPLAHTTSVKKAQLAMKALQAADSTPWHHTEPQTEPPTARVVDQPRLPQTKDMVMETPEDQMVLVKQAIDVLTDLLAVVNADIDTKADMPEQEAPEAEEAVDYDTLTKALEAMVDDDGLRQTLTKVAEPVDAAIAADDADALDTSIGTFLDEVEAAMGDEENADLLKTIAAMVADLIEYLAGDDDDEAPEPAEEPPTEDTVDIKRDYGPEAREKMAEDDEALDDGSFPIKNRTDLGNAIKAVGRAKDPDKARAHIKKRAKELDAEDMLPDSWNEEKVVLSADEIKAFVQQFNEK